MAWPGYPVFMKNDFDLPEGRLHSCHFVFAKCAQSRSDEAVLNRIGLANVIETQRIDQMIIEERCVFVARDHEWVHVAADWSGFLEEALGDRSAIKALSNEAVVLEIIIGDCDASYEYTVWTNGTLCRRRVVESPKFTDQKLVEDIGVLLPGEGKELIPDNSWSQDATIAGWLGIVMSYSPDTLRRFSETNLK